MHDDGAQPIVFCACQGLQLLVLQQVRKLSIPYGVADAAGRLAFVSEALAAVAVVRYWAGVLRNANELACGVPLVAFGVVLRCLAAATGGFLCQVPGLVPLVVNAVFGCAQAFYLPSGVVAEGAEAVGLAVGGAGTGVAGIAAARDLGFVACRVELVAFALPIAVAGGLEAVGCVVFRCGGLPVTSFVQKAGGT